MNININKTKLEEISQQTQELIKNINEGVSWSDNFLKDEQKQDTSYELKKYRRKLKKIKSAIMQKPVIALYGASQVGKSYLVKNILCDEKNQLVIPNPNSPEDKHEFISEMNPEGGGSEATGVVTRFSYTANPDQNMPPVKIKVLSPKDLITIFADSYFADFKTKKQEFKADDISNFLDEKLPNYYTGATQSVLDEDDVYDIEDYLDKFFTDNFGSRLTAFKDAGFWHTVAGNIHKVAYSNWGNIFAMLWGRQQKITDLFNALIQELHNINYSRVLYSGFDAVLRTEESILDVQRIRELLDNAGRMLSVEDERKTNFNVSKNRLSALTAEVVLNVSETAYKKSKFIDTLDILDFPGARNRLRLDENDTLTNENISDMALRGKVAYLFNTYSLNYEINNLFACTASTKSEVRVLPELINNWIEYNVGSTPAERAATLQNFSKPPFFVIFTFWNMQLDYDLNNDNKDYSPNDDPFEYKWKHRFETRIKEEFLANFKWHEEWTTGKPFKNYYLLRDYKYSDNVFDGFETSHQETEIKKIREKYFSDLEQSFVNSNLTKRFFQNPQEVWDNTSTLNKDGSQYIIGNIEDIANNKIKTQRYLNIINDAKAEVVNKLNAHYHSNDKDDQIKKAAETGSELQLDMMIFFGEQLLNFGKFIENLLIKESDIFILYHNKLKEKTVSEQEDANKYLLIKKNSPRLSPDLSYEENMEILRQDYHRDTIKDIEDLFKEKNVDLQKLFYGNVHELKNKSLQLAESARDFWFEKKLNVENFQYFVDLGFKKSLLEELFDNLKTSFTEKLKMCEKIALSIRKYVDRYNKEDKLEDMIAHITAGMINEFVNLVGWSYTTERNKEKLKEVKQKNKLSLKFPDEQEVFESPDYEGIEDLLDIIDKLDYYVKQRNFEMLSNIPMVKNLERWSELMKISFIANCDIPTYNVEANKALGKLIDKITVQDIGLE